MLRSQAESTLDGEAQGNSTVRRETKADRLSVGTHGTAVLIRRPCHLESKCRLQESALQHVEGWKGARRASERSLQRRLQVS